MPDRPKKRKGVELTAKDNRKTGWWINVPAPGSFYLIIVPVFTDGHDKGSPLGSRDHGAPAFYCFPEYLIELVFRHPVFCGKIKGSGFFCQLTRAGIYIIQADRFRQVFKGSGIGRCSKGA